MIFMKFLERNSRRQGRKYVCPSGCPSRRELRPRWSRSADTSRRCGVSEPFVLTTTAFATVPFLTAASGSRRLYRDNDYIADMSDSRALAEAAYHGNFFCAGVVGDYKLCLHLYHDRDLLIQRLLRSLFDDAITRNLLSLLRGRVSMTSTLSPRAHSPFSSWQ